MLIPTSENTKNVTDMREQAIQVLKDVKRLGVVYIMQRSDPKAVMLSIEEFKRMHALIEDRFDEYDARQLATEPRGVGVSHKDLVAKYAK